MKRPRIEKKIVTDAEFNAALANKDNQKIMKRVQARYFSLIPEDDLKACALDALWRCLAYHKDNAGNKFTTSLWTFTEWECRRELKKIKKRNSRRDVNISVLSTNDTFDIEDKPQDNRMNHVRECMALLPKQYKELIEQYYFDRMTMEEIGQNHGYSKEAARQKINKALIELRKICEPDV